MKTVREIVNEETDNNLNSKVASDIEKSIRKVIGSSPYLTVEYSLFMDRLPKIDISFAKDKDNVKNRDLGSDDWWIKIGIHTAYKGMAIANQGRSFKISKSFKSIRKTSGTIEKVTNDLVKYFSNYKKVYDSK